MYQTSRGLLLLTACFTGTSLFAQESEPLFLGTLRIESTSAQSLLGNEEITEEDIDRRNPVTVKEVFDGESSVLVSGGAPIAQKVFVNGIEESLLSVTIDGARQNKGAFHHSGNVLLDPSLLKAVEVTEGLAPADAGPGGLGGSIAYETMDARDLLRPDEAYGGMATVGMSDNGLDFLGTLSIFGQIEGFEYLFSGSRQTGGDYENGSGDSVPGTAADLTSYLGKMAFTTETGKRFEFAASETEDSGDRMGQGANGIYFIRPDFAEVLGRDNQLVDAYAKRTSYTATYTDEAPQSWFAPEVQLSYNEQEVDANAVWGQNSSLSGYLKNDFDIYGGAITGGVDFFNEKAEGEYDAGDTGGEETLWDIGIFAQARQDLTDRLSVTYGGRYDYQEFEGSDGTDFSSGGLSANGAVDVVLTETVTLNAGLATTWGGYELGEAALVNYGGQWDYDGFDTSRSNSARIGLRYENRGWAVAGALFYTEIDDIAAVLPTNLERGALTDMTSQGFDGSIAWTGERSFASIKYTYADVELDGDEIATTAYYFGRPVGSIFALEGGYEVTPEWRLGGTAEIALENELEGYELPSYEVFNAYAAYSPRAMEDLEIRLDVRNIFDESYVSRSSDGQGLPVIVALDEPGRTFALTAKLRF
ncbi:TonB-dependent receptor domain-containing protein [Amaricoccus macauensis]|uniref:TonB-dependent receptor domain-containing protein n=1 Tax=Amaricoccus macauensis TaxID=57001 RepID=UPI003C7EBEDB